MDQRKKTSNSGVTIHGDETSRMQRWEWWVAGILIAALALQCLAVVDTISPTFDAFAHVPAGYNYWVYGNFELYKHNPPLIQMIIALPWLLVGPDLPPPETSREMTRWEFARAFHELNESDMDRLFVYSRLTVILMSLALAFLVWRWCRRWFGVAGGWVGLSLLVFNPFYVGHSHVATLDVGTALLITLLFWMLARFMAERKWHLFAALSILFGLAQAAKFSSILLIPIVPLLMLAGFAWPNLTDPPGGSLKRTGEARRRLADLGPLILQWTLLGLAYVVIVAAAFGFDRMFTPFGEFQFVSSKMLHLKSMPELNDLPVPFPYFYMEGLDAQTYLNDMDCANYLLGVKDQKGFPAFFIVGFLSKMPLGFLALFFLCIPLWYAAARRRNRQWLYLLLPVITFLLFFSFFMKVQCGLRYLLPIFPLVVIFMAKSGDWLWRRGRWGKALLALCVLWNIYSCASIFPDYLSYFNEAWGGPSRGYRVLVNSDLDWGQDLKKARTYLREHPVEEVHTRLFMEMDPSTYGLPGCRDMKPFPFPGWILISHQHAVNALIQVPDHTWLLKFDPLERFGYSYLLYHITHEDLAAQYSEKELEAFRLANEADRIKEEKEAEAELRMLEALALHPRSWQIHQFIGQFYYDRGDAEKAMSYFRAAVKLNPDGELHVLLPGDDRAE